MNTITNEFRCVIGTMALLLHIMQSGAITCPTGAFSCETNVDYWYNDIGMEIVASFQECYDICTKTPQCMAASFKGTGECYQKYRLSNKQPSSNIDIAFIANNSAQEAPPSCESCSINIKCQDMQSIKSFSIMGSPVCVDQNDEIYFGDYNNDEICDAACFNRSTLFLQWGVGTSSMDHLQPNVSLVGMNQGNLGVFCDYVSTLYTRDANGDGSDDLVCDGVGYFHILFSDTNGLMLTSETVDYEKHENCPMLPSSCLINIGCTSVQSLCNCTNDLIEAPPHGTYEPQAGNRMRLNCNAGYIRRGQTDGFIFCDGLSNMYQRTSFCQKQDYKIEMNVENQKAANTIGFSYFESSNAKSLSACMWECNTSLRCQWLTFKLNESLCFKFEWQMKNKQLVDDYNSVVAWFPHE